MVAYDQWKAAITPELKPFFMPLERACENFNQAIFNYWRARYTNAYTEGINSFIRGVHNMGRGYSFEVLRAKMLFSQKAMVTSRRVDRDHFYLTLDLPFYGTDLSTLSDMLEHGDFG